MPDSGLVLITGGCRSGKSEYAEKLAEELAGRVTYLATSVVGDEEFAVRVRKHQERRPAHWVTVEEPLEIETVLKEGHEEDVILIDSLSGWLTNLMYQDGFENWQWDESKEKETLERVQRFVETAKRTNARVLVVSDEVGFGLVPPYPEGRAFRDLNGKANQIIAKAADKVFFVVAGIPMEIK
ncbi:MAG: adenosylcobinamide kinase / adenosylcobinamide-phosphate guanylyltransferase [Clostridia bacterium]|nr:adenosylcobinamide kinase/adenosylcobinamide phosphate guanyltransferase [Clostridiales bacterium]MDK2984863.1 adenosylcobinamide kinase / adenosylcobinamide-phosphate guanylyltransferase [Clostridia bacterium]